MYIPLTPFNWRQPRADVPPNVPALHLRNKGDAEPIDTSDLVVPCESVNLTRWVRDIRADFTLAKIRAAFKGLTLDTFQDEMNRIEGLPLISDPTNPPDPGGWLRTPENDAPA